MTGKSYLKTTALLLAALALAACEDGTSFPFLQGGPPEETDATTIGAEAATRTVEQDVEAPDVFAVNEPGLWDGRPSLGGVWVAHPEVGQPERVLIRNTGNDKSVVGGLYRREVNTPGPRIQVSSEAASALGMLAGQPMVLDVVALRREEVVIEEPAPVPVAGDGTPPLATDGIESSSLDAVATAAAAIEAAEAEDPVIREAAAEPVAAPAPASSTLEKPFVQIGIFNVEENANETANSLRSAGMVPTVRAQESSGKSFWRVVVGPSQTTAERRQILAKVRDLGYTDAYFVSN